MSGGENLNAESIFDYRTIDEIYEEIQKVYLSDDRPWIIGYSGGKDSSVALQLVWYAIQKLPVEKRNKEIYVISSNTLVESPVLLERTSEMLSMINKAAIEQSIPIRAEHITPKVENTFWVNLIGKGYPAPTKNFRWCTDRMKIRPADDFILEKVSKFGETILILGVRSAESITRKQVMELKKIKGSLLSRHSKYPQAFVYTPIEAFSLDDVWTYLLQVKNPWGANNRDLLSMYTGDKSGECPLVVDKSTGSCGNSRFGCWTCTVVSRDSTMENLVDSGEEWMRPMMEIRNKLYETTLPENKSKYRQLKSRAGYYRMKSDNSGKITHGPYKFEYSKQLLRSLLKAQKELEKNFTDKDFRIIYNNELHEIRRLWLTERGDWEDSLPKIYKEIMGTELDWIEDDTQIFSMKEKDLLDKICNENNLSLDLVRELFDVEKEFSGMVKRSGIYRKIDTVFNKDWRSVDEVIRDWENDSIEDKL